MEMKQLELTPTTLREALEAEIQAAGGWRLVAKALHPDKYRDSPDNAMRFLRNQINPDHNQKLDYYQAQLLKHLAKDRNGSSQLLHFDCDDLGYTQPSPIRPEDEKAKLQKDFINAVGRLDSIKKQLTKFN